jgi:DNA polymerase III subunit gamma/tau
VLRQVDRLMGEGHSPTHFARQMVRFLRNTLMAKIAGSDSSLLQISGDERARLSRTAELFSEEDLTRHLQIMLRTHGELGYRQEQRFHLELGLLKLAHAQRLLPIEQLLSEAASSSPAQRPSTPSTVSRPAVEPRRSALEPSRSYVSPFAADTARKGKPELSAESTGSGPRLVSAPAPAPAVVMGAAAPAAAMEEQAPVAQETIEEASPQIVEAPSGITSVRDAVLNAIGGQRMLASMLEIGEWSIAGNELVIKVAASPTVIDMSVGADAKRIIIATASGSLGLPVKLKILPGGTAQAAPQSTRASSNGSGRGRAEQEPVVKRLQEKFGAEIRTIIDYKHKR